MNEDTHAGHHAPREGEQDGLVAALEGLIHNTASSSESDRLSSKAGNGPYTPAPVAKAGHKHWWSRLTGTEGLAQSRLDELFADHHLGNYVAIRGSQQRIFESMPIAVRLGMHLLFFSSKKSSLLRYDSVEDVLQSMSIKQGKVYDDANDREAVLEHVTEFIKTYQIDTSELLQPDPTQYATMNSFFYRKLRPETRPITEPGNNAVISSAADCRLTVFEGVDSATKVWIKGKNFSIRHLLGDTNLADRAFPPGSSLAIFRLAPADYHRYHHSVGPAICGPTRHEAGEYYTVNPQAVNANFDVFTANRRDVLTLEWTPRDGVNVPVAFVAIGALLVGAIGWTKAAQGTQVARGDEAGYFAYGGSTCISVYPPSAKVKWDEDLLKTSLSGVETMVRVGERIGISEAQSSE